MVSRRNLLKASAALMASPAFADTRVAEVEARIARHDLKGLHKEDLPTPCMLVDQEIFDANLQRMANHCRTTGIHLRGHVKVHKSTEIARRQPNLVLLQDWLALDGAEKRAGHAMRKPREKFTDVNAMLRQALSA